MSPRSPPGPIVPGVHSSTPLGGIARRFSNDFATGSRANLIINQNGEPELVADLMWNYYWNVTSMHSVLFIFLKNQYLYIVLLYIRRRRKIDYCNH